ncbi:HelD family protein [Micromonospora parathelypteridis]|uniref:DNA helicase IV n=1 Tax=Micromonospora parathelypteridis TaxID=1839617 RepID=A0A840VVE9_9ACTN|nr:ATP-binding domain-containing protein [Micromonospora parathelypteridis]MBB5479966.1 DNA helicase IV [Micromonospora parathelypteridis]GGO25657.1 DNA helicase [Micromonospora parathelypteridis]
MSRHSGGSGELPLDDEIGREQEYVSMLYDRLDGLREQAAQRLTAELRNTGGTLQDRSQRDSSVAMYADQVEQFSAVENGLCFGRLDGDDDSRHYIGRLGIFDTSGDYDPLLMDWRAPAARPFYLATAANPQGVRRRRHLRTRQRKVTGLNDEVLDIGAASPGAHEELTGEASLLAALNAGRTGRMRDIVETIQAEQDEIIRAELPGVMVVQGGPGTGKTAVALHRAAYLLYTHRRELSSRGVLLVGPNATFLRYISQVLPTLAETGVLLRTQGDLFPGVSAQRVEPAETAALKGRAVLAEVLARAVRDRQWVPDEPLEIEVEREALSLDPETVRTARDRVRRVDRPHNLSRALFDTEVVHALADQVAERIGADPLGGDNLLDEADRAEIRRELREEPEIRAALDRLWPVLTPQRLLADLYADPDRIAVAAPMLTDDERALLHREPGGWTPADVPLLDEAAELLGEDERAAAARRDRIRRMEREYAEGVLEIARGSRSIDVEDEADGGEILGVTDLIDADRLLERQEEADRLTTAQRAAADRTWAFGHVIVDEAQELSPMAWRLLMRRCPSRSMTIVGDVAQTGALSGTPSWADALAPYVAQRWRLTELTVSYRTPAEIMAVAADVLAEIDPALRPPRSVRESGVPPWDRAVPDERLAAELVAAATREAAGLTEGRLGVLVPAGRVGELGSAVTAALPEAAVGEHPELESRVVVLTVAQAKGLEFDSVLVVDPDRMVAESPRGRSDLYVALTRATQRLGILRPGN